MTMIETIRPPKDVPHEVRGPVSAAATVRPVAEADLEALAGMVAALAAHHGDRARVSAEGLARDVLGPAPWLRVLILELEGAAAGYAALCPRAQLQFGLRGMDLHHLWLAPEARGRGFGRRLIEAAAELARAEGCAVLTTSADPRNWPAQEVYRACGFEALPAGGRYFRRVLAA